MSAITAKQVRDAAKGRVNENDLASVLVALGRYGDRFGLDRPHRLAQYFAQLMHESGDFPYDEEIWGRRRPSSATTRAPISETRWRRTEKGTAIAVGLVCSSPASTTTASFATGAERPTLPARTLSRIPMP